MNIPVLGEFVIPDNVYLVGTMNNTDKSLVGFDIALRRRFAFLRILPDMSVIERMPFVTDAQASKDGEEMGIAYEFANRARTLNEDLGNKLRLPSEKRIGHAYFLKVKDFCEVKKVKVDSEKKEVDSKGQVDMFILTEYALEQLWDYHLQPLLEEFLGLEAEEAEKVETMKQMKQMFCRELKP